jgi:hypothetical protein
MKTLTIGLTIATTILFQSVTFAAASAGTERGGGNLLEAAFSKAINQIEGELNGLGKRAKSKLKFSVEQYANASSGIVVECASLQEDIDYLKNKKRLAFVKNPGQSEDKVIYLNCYEQSQNELVLTEDWKNVLAGITNKQELSTTAKVLVTHEVFRAGGLEVREGDYSLSSSIKLAQMEQDATIKEQVVEIVTFSNKLCKTYFNSTQSCGTPRDYKYGNFALVTVVKKFGWGVTTDVFSGCNDEMSPASEKETLLSLDLSNPLTRRTFAALQSAKCFDGR